MEDPIIYALRQINQVDKSSTVEMKLETAFRMKDKNPLRFLLIL